MPPSSSRYLLLPLLALLTGALTAFLGYLLGQYFYVIFLYPLLLLLIGAALFFPSLKFLRTPLPLYNAFCGLLLGLALFLTFHLVEYSIFRAKNISTFETSQHLSASAASKATDNMLRKATGLEGFLGYMKYKNSLSNPYVIYIPRGDTAPYTLKIFLHGRNGWLYLAFEAAVVMAGSALLGFFFGRPLFKRKARPQVQAAAA